MEAMEQSASDAFAYYGERVHAFSHLSHVYAQGSSIYAQFVWPTAAGGFAPNLERWRRLKRRTSPPRGLPRRYSAGAATRSVVN